MAAHSPDDRTARMRRYWDERARLNAPWYVDTSLSYDDPDIDRFYETGRRAVSIGIDEAPFAPPGRELAVEIGSGLGRMCIALAERFEKVIGVDISSEMVARAGELSAHPNVSYVVGNGSSLDAVEDGTADVVLTFTVFQHIPVVGVIEGYIKEAGRVLKPGGLFTFQWNNMSGARLWSLRRAALSKLTRLGLGRQSLGRNDPAFLGSRVPLHRIERALAEGGMRLVRTDRPGDLYAWGYAQRVGS